MTSGLRAIVSRKYSLLLELIESLRFRRPNTWPLFIYSSYLARFCGFSAYKGDVISFKRRQMITRIFICKPFRWYCCIDPSVKESLILMRINIFSLKIILIPLQWSGEIVIKSILICIINASKGSLFFIFIFSVHWWQMLILILIYTICVEVLLLK